MNVRGNQSYSDVPEPDLESSSWIRSGPFQAALASLYPAITSIRTQRKLIELTMLTAMARKNLGLYFLPRITDGCHFTGNISLALTGTSAPERPLLFLGENRGKAAS